MSNFDPTSSPQLAPAWTAALTLLKDHNWHLWTHVVTAMTKASDIQPVTASNLLHKGVRNRLLARQGNYRQGTRQVRLDTPAG